MRTLLIALPITALLAVLGLDFARRVARMGGFLRQEIGVALPQPARPAHGYAIEAQLVGVDPAQCTIELRASAGEATQLLELFVDEIRRQGEKPLPTAPRRSTTSSARSLERRFPFREIQWQRKKDPEGFEAELVDRCRVRTSEDPPERWRSACTTQVRLFLVDLGCALS
ncbi:MAG: hypothetical protein JNM84_14590 [Planctomycetes bacterium]|nr:hypothetical protein [Planctomycetota bacterium]